MNKSLISPLLPFAMAAVLGTLLGVPSPALAEQVDQTWGLPVVDTTIWESFTGTPVMINAAYASRYEIEPPASDILLIVPQSDGIRMTPGGSSTGEPGLIRIDFADETLSHLAETLRLYALQIPEAALEIKFDWAAFVLEETLVPYVTNGMVEVEWLDFYITRIGDADAVSAHLGMRDPEFDEYRFLQATVLLDPRSANGSIFAAHWTDRTHSPVKSPDDIGIEGKGTKVLHSLSFMLRP